MVRPIHDVVTGREAQLCFHDGMAELFPGDSSRIVFKADILQPKSGLERLTILPRPIFPKLRYSPPNNQLPFLLCSFNQLAQ